MQTLPECRHERTINAILIIQHQELLKRLDSKGMVPLTKDAQDGGAVAGRTRKDIETQTGIPVISPENFKVLEGGRTKRLKDTERSK